MAMETLPSGTTLHGRYRIERVLGSGGFGHVYLAIDLQTNLQYAVKEYLVTGASGQVQLEHESRVLGQLHHPNLPAFQEAFDERGRYYVVLGYIEGSDLTDYIRVVRQRNETIPLTHIMNWILSICDAVAFLHSQQPPVIHRDIKPDNIRITSNGTAILVDLGNAKAAADGARTLFFIRHQGTPGYAPVEQYPGGTGTDVRSDVYALGGTLFFALTAQEPPSVSVRNSAIAQGQPDLPSLQQVLARNPPEETLAEQANRQFRLGVSKPAKPAPRHSRHLAQLGTLPPELLERLNRIIQRAMAMKQKDRYQSVVAFSSDLRQVLAAMQSSPPSPPSGPARPVDPHSTQPDLPFLFEAMQDAKANKDNSPLDMTATSTSQPSTPPGSVQYCPKCSAELLPKAAFCPRCGTPVTNTSQANVSNTPPTTNVYTNKASSQNKPLMSQASTDQTLVHPFQAPMPTFLPNVAPATTSPAPTTTPYSKNMTRSPSHTPAQNGTTSASTAQQTAPRSFMQNTPQTSSPPQASQTPSATTSASPTPSLTSHRLPKILFFLVVALVFILLIVAIFAMTLSRHHKTYHTLPGNLSYSFIEAPRYERGISSTSSAIAGVWTCRPGIPSTASIAQHMVEAHVWDMPGN